LYLYFNKIGTVKAEIIGRIEALYSIDPKSGNQFLVKLMDPEDEIY